MFQTEMHIALQSLSSDLLTWLMLQVTASGYYFFVIAMVIAVMFGFSLRKGFLLIHIIAWTAVASEIAKEVFGLPRPFFTDGRVACLDPHWERVVPLHDMGGRDFFDLPQQTAIEAFRQQGLSFGFPSGHTTGAMAMWGGLAVVFRKRALAWFAPFMVALIAFTRLYLGVHFLADILGGIALGGLMLFFAWHLIGKEANRERFFAAVLSGLRRTLPSALVALFLFILPLLLAAFSLLTPAIAGFYVGLNAAFILLLRSGLPADDGGFWVRLARVLLSGLLFWLLSLLLRQGASLLPAIAGSPWRRFLAAGLGSFLTLWGGLRLFQRLGLYRRAAPPVA